MDFITAVSPDFYNPEYFNLLEQFEYDQLYSDMTYIISESYSPVLEDDNGTVSTGKVKKEEPEKLATKSSLFLQRIKDFFKKVIELIKKVIRKFVDKADEYFKINEYFLKNQANAIATVKNILFWKKVNVTLYDYDLTNLGKTVYQMLNIPKIDERGNKLKEIATFDGTEDELKGKYFNPITRLQSTDDIGFKEAAKLYFRGVRSNQTKPVTISGMAAKDKVIKLLYYAQSYKDSYAKKIRDSLSDLEGGLGRVKTQVERNEFAAYVLSEAYEPSMEAKQPANGTVNAPGAHGDSLSSRKVKNKVGNQVFTRIQQYGNILITLHTAQMTVAEEAYLCAIHILKKIYSMARDQGYINVEKAKKASAKKYNEQKDVEDMQRQSEEIRKNYTRGKSETDAIKNMGSA